MNKSVGRGAKRSTPCGRPIRAAWAQPKEVLKELCNEPAKLADRSVAPGEASEPGKRISKKLRAPEGAADGRAARNHHGFTRPGN